MSEDAAAENKLAEQETPSPAPAFSVEDFLKSLRQELAPVEKNLPNFDAAQVICSDGQSLMKSYAESYERRALQKEDLLVVLNGSQDAQSHVTSSLKIASALKRYLQPERYQLAAGGFFLRWKGQGVVINPGRHFLEHFHDNGLFVQDIDCVIVTSSKYEDYSGVKGIYELNYEQNRTAGKLHIIHYYIHQGAYQNIVATLKPHFKQERNTIHPLEFYLDSPELETVQVTDHLKLQYFACEKRTQWEGKGEPSGFGLRMELFDEGACCLSIGWLLDQFPETPISTLNCDLIILAAQQENLSKLIHQKTTSNAPLLLYSELRSGLDDHRLNSARTLKENFLSPVLPADTGLRLQLPSLNVTCSLCGMQAMPTHMRVIKCRQHWGTLQYLCPECAL